MKHRVVITGLGVVSPIGIGKEVFWKGLLSGECGIDLVTRFDASSYPCKLAAEVKDFEPVYFIPPKSARRLSRLSQFAIIATQKALEDANLELSQEDPYRVGVSYGSEFGPLDIYEKFGATFYERGLKRVHPLFEGLMNHNAVIGALAHSFDIRGYNSVSTGGNVSIVNAYSAILNGIADIMITGGGETPIYPLHFGLLSASQAMTTYSGLPNEAMCPYDKRRSGFVIGEGAGTLILEDLKHAQRRGARIYSEILSCGLTNDAAGSSEFNPDITGNVMAFKIALSNASLEPQLADYICGCANSSVFLDQKEAKVIKEVFGSHAHRVPVSSISAMIGHSRAAAAAMQTIAASLAIDSATIPPTINYQVPDPECDLDIVTNKATRRQIHVAVVNSLGISGTNVVIALANPNI